MARVLVPPVPVPIEELLKSIVSMVSSATMLLVACWKFIIGIVAWSSYEEDEIETFCSGSNKSSLGKKRSKSREHELLIVYLYVRFLFRLFPIYPVPEDHRMILHGT